MGRPVKKEFLGTAVDNASASLLIDSAYIPGASAVSSNVSIVKQKGTRTYEVTDGTNTGVVRLVDKTDSSTLVSGEAISLVNVVSVSSGDFEVTSIILDNGGHGYKTNDTLTVGSAGTVTVTSVSSGVAGQILSGTATVSTNALTSDPAGTGVASTGGSGTGATFNVTSTNSTTTEYTPASVVLNAAGTGYAVNDKITIPNVGTVTVASVTDGVIATITTSLSTTSSDTDMAGTGVTGTGGSGSGATFNITSTQSTVTTYKVSNITIDAAGENYSANDILTIGDAGTYKVETVVDASSIGTIQTISASLNNEQLSTNPAATGVASTGGSGTGATFDVTAKSVGGDIEHAMTIYNRTVQTWEGNVHPWLIYGSTTVGYANLTTKQN